MIRSHGFTMIEILIAVFIFAVGFLGAGALQITSLQANQNNMYQTQAIFIANEIANHMRANLAAAKDSDAFDDIDSKTFSASLNECKNADTGCNSDDLASNAILEWSNNFKEINGVPAILPNGSGTVTRIDGKDTFEIKILWNERDWQGNTNVRSNTETNYTLMISL